MLHLYPTITRYRLVWAIVAFFIGGLKTTSAQSPQGTGTGGGQSAGTIIPPAPKTASLGTFGQLPVDLNRGAVAVSVPLLEAHSGQLSLPIGLSFNTTGSKVSEGPSWVGQGWNLSAGGVVARTVRGRPDELADYGYQTVWPQWNYTDSMFQRDPSNWRTRKHAQEMQAYASNWDLEADTYNVSVPGYSGTLACDAVGHCYLSPDNGWRISGDPASSWTLVSPEGTRYDFAVLETSTSESDSGIQESFIAAWHLSSVTSADGQDIIDFLYSSDGPAMQVSVTQAYQFKFAPVGVSIPDNIATNDCNNCRSDPPSAGSLGQNYQSAVRVWRTTVSLSEIRSATQRVVFHSALLPQHEANGIYPAEAAGRLLRSIEELPAHGDGVRGRAFTFSFRYTGGNSVPGDSSAGRHYLMAVQEVGKPPTRFTYYTHSDSRYSELPSRNSFSQDHWGYSNGGANTTLIPQLPLSWNYLIPGGANRATNPRYLWAGSLSAITYPTGGSTHFFYEPNTAITPVFFDIDEPAAGEQQEVHAVSASGNTNLNALSQQAYDVLYTEGGVYSYSGMGTPYVSAAVMDLPAGARSISITTRDTPPPSSTPGVPPPTLPMADLRIVRLNPAAADPVADALLRPIGASDPVYSTVAGHITVPNSLPPGSYLLLAVAFDAGARALLEISLLPSQAAGTTSNLVERTVGGLRIRRMVDYPGAGRGDSMVTTYDYTAPAPDTGLPVTSGQLFIAPSYIQRTPCGAVILTARDNTALPSARAGGFHIGYSQVRVSRQQSGTNGSTLTRYFNSDEPDSRNLVLLEKITDAKGQLVKETNNAYAVNPVETRAKSARLSLYRLVQIKVVGMESCGWSTVDEEFSTQPYSFVSVRQPLVRTQVRLYEPVGGTYHETITLNRYTLDRAGHFRPWPSEIAAVRSAGDTVLTWRKYVTDFALPATNTTDPVVGGLAELSCHEVNTAIIEEWHGHGSAGGRRWLTGSLSEYESLHPRRTWSYPLSTPRPSPLDLCHIQAGVWHRPLGYQLETSFDKYSTRGKLLGVHHAHGLPTSYLWGDEQPIAQIINMPYGAGAYTSFEPRATGRWQYDSLGSHFVNNHFTGTRGYQLDGTAAAAVQCHGLAAGMYELMFWSHGANAPQVTGALQQKDESVAVVGDWHQHRMRLTVPANATVAINSTPNQLIGIDELRLHPVGAQMTTYTYNPLIGVLSQTDANGRTTTYEYDALGRLVRTRDEQGRVLSQQQYHYAKP